MRRLHEAFPNSNNVELRNVAAQRIVLLKTELDYLRLANQWPDLAFAHTLCRPTKTRTIALKVVDMLRREEGINRESMKVRF